MLCELQGYSKVTQSYVYMCLLVLKFFSRSGYYRILSRVPVLYGRSLLVISFKDSSVYVPTSNFQASSPPTLPPPAFW